MSPRVEGEMLLDRHRKKEVKNVRGIPTACVYTFMDLIGAADRPEECVTMKGSPSDVRFLLFLLASSLAFNAFLAYRIWRPEPGEPPGLVVGQVVPPAEVATSDGRQELIRYSE